MLVDEGKFAPHRIASVAFCFILLLLHFTGRSAHSARMFIFNPKQCNAKTTKTISFSGQTVIITTKTGQSENNKTDYSSLVSFGWKIGSVSEWDV